MKLAICSQGKELESAVDSRFGRCEYFVTFDTKTREHQAMENPGTQSPGGAGIQTAQFLANHGIDAVLAGNVGPKAASALSAAGVKIYTGISGSVGEAVSQFQKGDLTLSTSATVGPHSGVRADPNTRKQGGSR